MRFADGVTRRANSCLCVGVPDRVEDTIGEAEAWYRELYHLYDWEGHRHVTEIQLPVA